MKIFFFITTLLLHFSINAFSQSLTIQDLIKKTDCKNTECFKSFIIKKGFYADTTGKNSKSSNTNDCYYSTKHSTTSEKVDNTKLNYTCISGIREGKTKTSFGTSNKSDYRSILSELDSLKFQPTKSSGEENKQITIYYNSKQYPNIKVIVTATSEVNDKEENIMSYLFEVCIE